MAQPRYKVYTRLAKNKEREIASRPVKKKMKQVFTSIFIILVVGAIGYYLLNTLPFKSSMSGEYTPPLSMSQITSYSRARWHVHSAHTEILTSCIAWYETMNPDGEVSLQNMEQMGFLPFRFMSHGGSPLKIVLGTLDTASEEDYLLVVGNPSGTETSVTSRRSLEMQSMLGKRSIEHEDVVVGIIPEEETRLIVQFQPEEPEFAELYAGFLAQVWDRALAGYVRTYNKPPADLDSLLAGIGLEMNPDCAWPFEEDEELDVDVEGGVIDGKIIYWLVRYEDETTGGQARYWDQYTQFDDPDTPQSIVAGSVNSTVIDPLIIEGEFDVMFNFEIYATKLFAVKPVEEDELED